MSTTHTESNAEAGPTRIDGPPAAALIAAGIGAAVLGLFVTWAEASTGMKDFCSGTTGWDRSPARPCSRRSPTSAPSWCSDFGGEGRMFALRSILIATVILVVLGLLITFPPIFQAFASE